ncbi:ketopantoate reductase family protein [Kroppenstedtia eburnea]|uniref:ketopantoate reductase family protein n=1 Tax=Kroppenstedtia eburnea TaxID=714067 RepID=UPI0036356AFB
MRVAVWGGGSLGLLWADRLAGRFPETILITRTRAQRDEIEARGLRVTGIDGACDHRDLQVEWAGSERLPRLDAVFITVKQRILPRIAPRLAEVCSPSAPLFLWQNGLGGERFFLPYFSPGQIYRAVTTEGALRKGPADVCHTGSGESWVGPACGGDFSPVVERLIQELSSESVPIHSAADLRQRVWEKLAVNCVINPLTALWKLPNGALPERDGFSSRMEEILGEVAQVARMEGIPLSVVELRKKILSVCRRTATNRSSMLQDLDRGEPTEVDFINGAVVEIGRKRGVPTPHNEHLTRLIHQAEGGTD